MLNLNCRVIFLAVDINALHGSADNVEYTYFDCRVSGKEAQDVVRRAMPHLKANRKVLVSFKLGDLYVDQFIYKKGPKDGQIGTASCRPSRCCATWSRKGGIPYKLPRPRCAMPTNEAMPGTKCGCAGCTTAWR